ncbi:complement inhibitor SCIN family protein [Staphylococcus argenteus]|uniref:complement inhibitor SCIN family protein n=1 Tax=Staphylococcus argenteus TaxID=985002 RepID=UPI001FC7D957|nr:complement inhibitor SCIN family protein [Staphylococcus argenteus]GJG19004.1 complement inhibitor SCIN family protein [Staphylococcus argenteus]
MTTHMKIKNYLVTGIKAALLDTTGITITRKSETTAQTYQHQPLVDQLHMLITNTDINKLAHLHLDAYQKRDIMAAHYIAKSAIRTKNLDQMTKAKYRLENIYSSLTSNIHSNNL